MSRTSIYCELEDRMGDAWRRLSRREQEQKVDDEVIRRSRNTALSHPTHRVVQSTHNYDCFGLEEAISIRDTVGGVIEEITDSPSFQDWQKSPYA